MKTRLCWLYVSVVALVLSACSADYDYTINLDTHNLKFISLKTNFEHTTVGVDQTLSFSVIDDISAEDYTPIANIFVNGQPFSGNHYTFDEVGEYVFTARVEDLETNPLTIQVVNHRFVTVSKSKALRGQDVNFKFYNSSGEDITSTATFFVNGSAISGSKFNSIQAGDYEVFAQYGGTGISKSTSFEVFVPRRKVSFEDYTGTWCGWCPRVTTAVRLLKEASNDVVAIAIHNKDEMVHSVSEDEQLRKEFNVAAFPAARLNRTTVVPTPEDSQSSIDFVLNQAGTETNISIAIDTKLSGDLLNIQTKVISENSLPSNYKLVVYLYQDGLIFPQTNYYNPVEGSPWYGMGNTIPDFVHDDVLEVSLTDIFGEAIEHTPAYTEYVKSFTPVNLRNYQHLQGENTYDPARFGVAVYLVNQNNETLNAQHVKAGKNIGFE